MLKWKSKYLYIAIPILGIIFIYILSSLFSNTKENLVELPLRKKFIVSDNNFPESLLTNNLHTTLKISDKKQEINMYIQASQFAFYITQITDKNKEEFKENNDKFYSNIESNTFKQIEGYKKFNFVPFFNGYVSNELFDFNGKKLDNLKFIYTDNPFLKVPGGIGLNMDEYMGDGAESLISLFKKKGLIKKQIWSINYKNTNEGSIYFGLEPHEFDNKFDKKNIRYSPIWQRSVMNYKWDLLFDRLYIGKNIDKESVSGKTYDVKSAELRAEYGMMFGSPEYHAEIKEVFFQELFNNNICEEKNFIYKLSTYKYIICNNKIKDYFKQFPNIYFYMSIYIHTFEMNAEDLFYKYSPSSYIFLVMFDSNPRYFEGRWILGEPFLKKYSFVYDADNKKIGFYSDYGETSVFWLWKLFLWVLILVIIGLIIVFLYNRIVRGRNIFKRDAKELENDYKPQKITVEMDSDNK